MSATVSAATPAGPPSRGGGFGGGGGGGRRAGRPPPPPPPNPPPRLGGPAGVAALTVADMRRAPSVYKFLTNLAEQFRALHAVEAEAAFEQSELYKVYVTSGVMLMNSPNPSLEKRGTPSLLQRPARPAGGEGGGEFLTREEVEAITDFRQQLRKAQGS